VDFLADENVPSAIIARLRALGLTVQAVAETRAGISDFEVLAAAGKAGLVLITQDQDFGELAILRQVPVSGIVLLELERLPLDAQCERVGECVADAQTQFAGRLTVIEPARTRYRALPRD
jgi:predicted nuclease of predicted toxin-antitoxin system